uniref:Uncharacterized protein n=1 Tax=Ascaris lumbricoides TaxID=6252 RepID=A0A0M3IBL6_ASCLU
METIGEVTCQGGKLDKNLKNSSLMRTSPAFFGQGVPGEKRFCRGDCLIEKVVKIGTLELPPMETLPGYGDFSKHQLQSRNERG